MAQIDTALKEFRQMDELSVRSSPIHSLNSLGKFLITVYYIIMVVSLDKYELNRLFMLLIYPLLMFMISDTSVKLFFIKMRYVLPLVMAVGIINPFLDKTPMLNLHGFIITGGIISMLTLMIKGVCCVMASFALIATTRFDDIAAALRRIHVPEIIVTLMLLTYRYISVMMDELSVMTMAYKLRAPGQKGIHYSAWGSFLGQLFLRSMDRAEELYQAMIIRGYDGKFRHAKKERWKVGDLVFVATTVVVIFVIRKYDIGVLLGELVIRILY